MVQEALGPESPLKRDFAASNIINYIFIFYKLIIDSFQMLPTILHHLRFSTIRNFIIPL